MLDCFLLSVSCRIFVNELPLQFDSKRHLRPPRQPVFALSLIIPVPLDKMDGSQQPNNAPQGGQPMVGPQQHSNLIRTDQVQKLPHLNDQQKATHTQLVRSFWEMLNNRDPQSPEYQTAHIKLTQLSQKLMKDMRMFQQSRQQALQQHHQQAQAAAAATAQGQPVQRSQSANPQSFQQLLPQIQTRVNSLNFFLPPSTNQEQIQGWLPEARLRYGIALQKQEIGRARMNELRQQFAQRQTTGNLGQEEMQEFKNRQLAAEKLFREGSDFLTKFKDQQEGFKAAQQNQQFNRAASQNVAQGQAHPQQPTAEQQQQQQQPQQSVAATPTATTATTGGPDNRPANAAGAVHPGQTSTPAPHTINSAVSAARNQAGQAAMTPPNSQPGQTPIAAQAPAASTAGTPVAQQQQQPQQPSQGNAAAPQMTYNQPPNGSTPTPTAPQAVNAQAQAQAQPRPLSHQAAMTQAAQNYTNNANANANNNNMAQTPTSASSQPQGYMQNRAENTARNINMAIPKNLNVQPPEPVAMAPARPTLSGGPSHGAMGMMGQPAIQKHPGYVLEGDGQRVLSKKMLDILVRQVTGGGEGEGLTPDAEEVSLPPPYAALYPVLGRMLTK